MLFFILLSVYLEIFEYVYIEILSLLNIMCENEFCTQSIGILVNMNQTGVS